MTRLVRAVIVTALTLSVVVAVGCGGDTAKNNDYVEKINKVQTDFADSIGKLSAGASPQESLKNLQTALGKVVGELKAVDPPDKVEKLHQDLIDEIDQLGKEVGKFGEALASGDVSKLQAAQAAFTKDAGELQTRFGNTIAEINKTLQG